MAVEGLQVLSKDMYKIGLSESNTAMERPLLMIYPLVDSPDNLPIDTHHHVPAPGIEGRTHQPFSIHH